MKFFLDSANLEELKLAATLGIVDGVTTNPSLIAKEGFPVEEQIRKICDIIDGDISAEVVSTDAKEMILEIRRPHRNVDLQSSGATVPSPADGKGLRPVSQRPSQGVRNGQSLIRFGGGPFQPIANAFPFRLVGWFHNSNPLPTLLVGRA
jgi:transaldolase